MKIAANITLLFPDLPLEARIARAADLGFDGVECLFPYEIPADRFAGWLQDAGMPLSLINTPVPDWAQGARGRAAVPGEEVGFRADLATAIDYARRTGASRLHVLAGKTGDTRAFDTFVHNLRSAADAAPDLVLTIEPLNPHDMPGYWLNDFDLAARVLDAVDRPNVALQYDIWHAHKTTGDALAVWRDVGARAGHVQIAGLAARGAPDPNAPDETAVLGAIAQSGYDGWISAEYLGASSDDARWLEDARALLQSHS